MVDSRLLTAAAGLAVSVAVSVLLWLYFETLLVFLFLPFIPFLFRGVSEREQPAQSVRECPQCDFRTPNDEYDYCPRDGRRLQESRESTDREGGWS